MRKKNRFGQDLTLDCRWTLVDDAKDAPKSVLCIETDITEKKKLEGQIFRAQRMESIGTLAGGIPDPAGTLPSACGAELDVCACACSMFVPTPRMIKHPISNTAGRYAPLPSPFLRLVPSIITLLHPVRA